MATEAANGNEAAYNGMAAGGIIGLSTKAGELDPGANTGTMSHPVKRGESAKACVGANNCWTAENLNQAQMPL